MKILAVVVTHNRLALLRRCIDHLQRQSRAPDRTLVVNNASTDGTEEFLKENGINHITQGNTGASGGWSTGIVECLNGGYDYVWLMDDDGYPEPTALESLTQSLTPDIACLSSVVVKENAPEELVFGLPHLDRLGQPSIFALKRKYHTISEVPDVGRGHLYPYAHMFNGALINSDTIRKIGNVERAFFVYGEELDYLWRMKKVGGVFTHTNARHLHPDVTSRPMREAGIYYFVRNSLVIARRYLAYRRFRALMTLTIVYARILRRNGFGEFVSYLAGRNQRVIRMAVRDGFAQRLGIFNPSWTKR